MKLMCSVMSVLVFSGLAMGATEAFYSGQPEHVVALTPTGTNTFSYTANYSWYDETSANPEILGSWANDLWSYVNIRQFVDYGNSLSLKASPRGTMTYHFTVPTSIADVTVEARIRRGITVRYRPNSSVSFTASSTLLVNSDDWAVKSMTIPQELLDTSVPGQISFQLKVENEGSHFAGGISALSVSAVARDIVAMPTFEPDGGTYNTVQTVTIGCATEGATIRYTTDGSDPSEINGSVIASGSTVTIDRTTTLKARAWKDGIEPSPIKSAQYNITIYTGQPQNVVTLTPTGTDTYGFTANYAWYTETAKQGEVLGSWAQFPWSYTNVRQNINAPNALNLHYNPLGVIIYHFVVPVSMAEITVNAEIRRGITLRVRPNSSDSFYATLPLLQTTMEWLPLSAVIPTDLLDTSVPGQVGFELQIMNESADFAAGIRNLNISALEKQIAAMPAFDPNGGVFYAPQEVTISCDTPGAQVRYTNDGTDPSETNGTLVISGDKILISQTTTLKARAWAQGMEPSMIRTASFSFPTTYSRPVMINSVAPGTVTVDGTLTDWADAQWAPLDQNYSGSASDVTSASYAAKWAADGSKIYVVVKVQDTLHVFSDTYTSWNSQDAVEIYLHTTGTGGVDFNALQEKAQQYIIGFNQAGTALWTVMGNSQAVPGSAGLQVAGSLGSDGWLYYEIALTPFNTFGAFTSQPNVVSTLHANEVIGLDIVVGSRNDSAFAQKSENTMAGKWNDYTKFGNHRLLLTTVVHSPGDANGDGSVDVGDLGILAANYGGSGKNWSQGDFNGDTFVDVGDLGILAAHYGQGSSSTLNFNADYAKVFGTAALDDEDNINEGSAICSVLGLPLIVGLVLMGLMLVKWDE
jgi:LysM repeat protein